MTSIPPPGLSGDYQGACIICLRGTDTGLAFQGEGEWIIAGLRALGVPKDEVTLMFAEALGLEPGRKPPGELTHAVQCCEKCASSAGFKVGLIATDVPLYRQPDE